MNYCELFTPHHLAILHDWLLEVGRISVRIERPHSGGSGDTYVVQSLSDLQKLLVQESHPELEIMVFRKPSISEGELDNATDQAWVYKNAANVLYLAVKKNRSFYQEYESNPARYENTIRDWNSGD